MRIGLEWWLDREQFGCGNLAMYLLADLAEWALLAAEWGDVNAGIGLAGEERISRSSRSGHYQEHEYLAA